MGPRGQAKNGLTGSQVRTESSRRSLIGPRYRFEGLDRSRTGPIGLDSDTAPSPSKARVLEYPRGIYIRWANTVKGLSKLSNMISDKSQ